MAVFYVKTMFSAIVLRRALALGLAILPAAPVFAQSALEYRDVGEFAKCGQQALVDAGFDPRGVDGKPGTGARSALRKWAKERDVNAPRFDKANASQVCYLLTAPENRYGGKNIATKSVLWPIFSSTAAPRGGRNWIDVELIEGPSTPDVILPIQQISAVDFGKGLRFEDRKVRGFKLPWSPKGTVRLHAQTDLDGWEDPDGRYSKLAVDMLRLLDETSPESGAHTARKMTSSHGFWFPAIRRALGATKDVGEMPTKPEWLVHWSEVDQIGENRVVAADIMLHPSTWNTRILIFMSFNEETDDDRLLYGAVVQKTSLARETSEVSE